MKLKNITEENIRDIADSTVILARGLNYYETGQIESMDVEDEKITAKVKGSYGIYDVEVYLENEEIHADCDCPYDGYGCKHIVAALYKWIDEKSNKKIFKLRNRKKINIKKELSKFDKEELLNIILGFCEHYEDVKRDIILKICKDTTVEDHSIIFKQIKDAFYTREGFIDYYTIFEVVKRLEKIKESILSAPPNTRSQLLKELVKRAIRAYESCDDSSGSMGDFVVECLSDIGKSINEQNLSFEKKKVIILENFDLMEKDGYGFDDGYTNLLLEVPSTKKDFNFMIKELKTRIEKQKEDYEREKYEDILTKIYKKAGKDKEYLTILEENAQKEGNYLPLAEFWREKGDIKKAIEVAEKGIKVKKDEWSSQGGLFEFLEEIYCKQKNKKNLLRVSILHYKKINSLSKYKEIMDLCKELGNWEKTREELIQNSNNYTLVEIYLFENMPEKAYEVLMKSKIQFDKIKDKVAKALIDQSPEKSLKIYSSIVKQFTDKGKRDNYKIVALYAKKVREIYLKINQKKKWDNYIATLREENKRRPALIEEFRRL